MKRQILTGAISAGFVVACCGTANAQDVSEATRLQKLEQAVTQLQAENQQLKGQIQTEAAGPMTGVPEGKFDISQSVTSIQLFGELLIRYFVNEGSAAGRDSGDVGQEDRLRYRLRLGTNIKVADGWSMGVVLETNSAARSANVTLGNGGINDGNFGKGNVGNGVTSGINTTVVSSITTTNSAFVTGTPTTTVNAATGAVTVTGKTTTGKAITGVAVKNATLVSGKTNFQDALFVGQVFLKYQPFDWMTLEAGKFRPNLVSTRMIWDADICPEGLGENFLWHFGDTAAHGPAGPTGYDKDSKDTKMVAPPQGMSFDLFANFAQYVYDDAGFENAFNSGNGTAASPLTQNANNTSNWLLGFQLGGKVNFNPTTYFQIAPTYYCYTEGGAWSNSGFFNGDSALVIVNKNAATVLNFNQTSTNNLGIFDVPVEFGSKIGTLPFTVFGDFADNLYAHERASNAGHPDKGNEGIAWQAGLSLGGIKHKGDWEIRGWYQRSEQYALDPNIIDDDIFDGRLNMQGIYVKATYALADAVNVSLEYCNGHRIDSSLGTAGAGAQGTALGFPEQSVNFWYLNFGLKF